ncbi:MAG: hypothetical protein ABSG90_05130 [Dehalococcoidia bacterium]|jgi:hypothetical protein
MAEKFKKDPPGWQKGSQGTGLTAGIMAVIVAIMIFSFWICRAGPFSTAQAAEPVNSMRGQAIVNPGANALHAYASGSENYSNDVSQVLNKLQNSSNTSSQ